MNPAVAAALAGGLALVGRGLGWLTTGGALAALAVGTAIFAAAGMVGAALLGLLFVSGSVLTALSRRSSRGRINIQSGGRTARQVIANGAWAAAAVLLPGAELGWPLLTGSLSAAQADTWATEIGAFSARPPRLLSTGEIVTPGTSGGVTVVGSLGGLAGGAGLAGLAVLLGLPMTVGAAALVGGVLGAVADSLLGATLQVAYYCTPCQSATERRHHSCGRRARRIRGWAWLDNDAVNFIATGLGGFAALGCWYLL